MKCLNRFNLIFDDAAQEEKFEQETYARTVQQGRIAIFLGAVVYLSYGILDYWQVPPEHQATVWQIRLGTFLVPLIVFALTYTPWFKRVSYISLAAVGFTAGIGFMSMLLYVPVENSSLYYPALVLVTFYTYNLVGTRFIYAFVLDMVLLVSYNLIFAGWKGYPLPIMVSHDFFIISANLVGGVAGYLQEYQLRQLFVHKGELEKERHEQAVLSEKLRESVDIAESASRASSEFLANMSHEIRTPLSNALGMLHLMELETEVSTKQHIYIDNIRRSGEHLIGVINDILDFSQIEAGKLTIEHINLSLDALKHDIEQWLGDSARKKHLKLIFDFDPAIQPPLIGDPLRLRQILLNYINNAIKFSEYGDITIRVSIQTENETAYLLRFEVKDQGIGIAADKINNLFQPFQQVDASNTRKYGGSGLGLVICKRIAQLMEGEVGVNSIQGKGSSFWFTTHVFKGQATERGGKDRVAQVDVESAKALLNGLRILMVDDNSLNREVVSVFLQRAGVQVAQAETGKEALEKLQQSHFDCVLMDIQMPVMGGLEAIASIRKDPALSDMIVIAMTASASNRDRECFLAAGMNDFISKPFDPKLMYVVLAKWLGDRSETLIQPKLLHTLVVETDPAKHINLSHLSDFFEEDDDEIMQDFMSKARVSLQNECYMIEAAYSQGDLTRVGELAHLMLTTASMLGASDLVMLCRALERCPKTNDPRQIAQWIENLNNVVADITLDIDHALMQASDKDKIKLGSFN